MIWAFIGGFVVGGIVAFVVIGLVFLKGPVQ